MKKILLINIIGFLILLSVIPAVYATLMDCNMSNQSQNIEKYGYYNDFYDQYPIMSYDFNMVKDLKDAYFKAEKAYINPNLNNEIFTTTNFSIIDLLNYIPDERKDDIVIFASRSRDLSE